MLSDFSTTFMDIMLYAKVFTSQILSIFDFFKPLQTQPPNVFSSIQNLRKLPWPSRQKIPYQRTGGGEPWPPISTHPLRLPVNLAPPLIGVSCSDLSSTYRIDENSSFRLSGYSFLTLAPLFILNLQSPLTSPTKRPVLALIPTRSSLSLLLKLLHHPLV